MEKTFDNRSINNGKSSYKDSPYPLGREAVKEIINALMKENKDKHVTYANAIVDTFLCMGRGGECSYLTYRQLTFEGIERVTYVDWNEKKTYKMKTQIIYPDHSIWELDFYFITFDVGN